MSEEMVFRLILKPWNSRVLLAGPVQWRRNPEATPPVGAVKQTQTGISTALPCLQYCFPDHLPLTSPPRPLLRFGRIPSLTGSTWSVSPFYQCSAGASLTWSNPPRRQGLEAQNQWYVDQVLPHAHQSISCLGFPVNCPSTISLARKLAGTCLSCLLSFIKFLFNC